jgi:hypothetical protein
MGCKEKRERANRSQQPWQAQRSGNQRVQRVGGEKVGAAGSGCAFHQEIARFTRRERSKFTRVGAAISPTLQGVRHANTTVLAVSGWPAMKFKVA